MEMIRFSQIFGNFATMDEATMARLRQHEVCVVDMDTMAGSIISHR